MVYGIWNMAWYRIGSQWIIWGGGFGWGRTEIHSSVANLLVVRIHHVASERSFVADHQLKNRANDERKTRDVVSCPSGHPSVCRWLTVAHVALLWPCWLSRNRLKLTTTHPEEREKASADLFAVLTGFISHRRRTS